MVNLSETKYINSVYSQSCNQYHLCIICASSSARSMSCAPLCRCAMIRMSASNGLPLAALLQIGQRNATSCLSTGAGWNQPDDAVVLPVLASGLLSFLCIPHSA